MIPILALAVGLAAATAWVMAATAAIRIVMLAPRGQRMRNYFRLGWWQFGALRTDLGPGVEPLIRTYRRAFLAFFVCILGGMVLGVVATMTAPRPLPQS